MRNATFLLAGFLLYGSLYLLGRLFGEHYPNAPSAAVIAFLVVWLVATLSNLFVGINQAGYGLMEELPYFLGLFAVPATVAVFVRVFT